MRLAIGFSTKDQVELTKQTLPALLRRDDFDLLWIDGSRTSEGQYFFQENAVGRTIAYPDVFGGADAAIAFKLSTILASPANYTHIGLAENDVLLSDGWFEETMALFERGAQDGLEVGAVSPRSYTDRVLIQRDGYACMLNIGAGFIIFTREAAQIILRTFRTGWWPDIVALFAQLSGIDIRTYACFRGNEQNVTTDWQFEAQLAAHGLASLALTPAKVQMIGQNPPLAEQGLELVPWTDASRNGLLPNANNDPAFNTYRDNLAQIRAGKRHIPYPGIIHTSGDSQLFFPHQLGHLGATWQGTSELQWCQGFGPFAYRAGPGGASLSVPVFGSCGVLASGGLTGAQITIQDLRSGFKFAPMLPPDTGQPASIAIPGGAVPRTIQIDLAEGAVFHGLSTDKKQAIDLSFSFQWDQLPPAT